MFTVPIKKEMAKSNNAGPMPNIAQMLKYGKNKRINESFHRKFLLYEKLPHGLPKFMQIFLNEKLKFSPYDCYLIWPTLRN